MKYLLLASSLVIASPFVAPDTEVTGARVSLVPKQQPTVNVTIENGRTSPLVECQLDVHRHDGKSTRMVQDEKLRDDRAVAAGARTTIAVRVPDEEPYDVTIRLAAFGDGYIEGKSQAVEARRKEQQEQIEDLEFWAAALEHAPRVSERDLRAYLAERLAARAGMRAGFDSATMSRLQRILKQYPAGPEVWRPIDELTWQTSADLAGLKPRSESGTGAKAADVVQSVRIVSQTRSQSEKFAIRLENLRASPIDAFEVDAFDPRTGRSTGGTRLDYCTLPAEDPFHRRTRQGEPQEIDFSLNRLPSGELPQIRLVLVAYDDLVMEGSAAARDRLLSDREDQAADYAFAIDAIREALAQPVPNFEAFLRAKRAERAKSLVAEKGSATRLELDTVLLNLTAPGQNTAEALKRQEENLVATRERLLRHQKR